MSTNYEPLHYANPQFAVNSSLLAPFVKHNQSMFFLNGTDQASYPCKKAGNITVLSTFISTFLDNRQEVRAPLTACQQVFS